MEKMIYIVTSGSYSDYRIDAVFDNREDAERMVSLMPHPDDSNVEEYELNALADRVRQGLAFFKVHMLKDGTTKSVYKNDLDSDPSEYFYAERKDLQGYAIDNMQYVTTPAGLYVGCLAKDEQHAIKITNEIRIQRIASNRWE